MFQTNCETSLISQLLNSIDNHLKIIHLPMEQYKMSIDNSDDDDELWLSGHRSIFSSYGSHYRKYLPSCHHSQCDDDDFHWDFYENPNYHQLTFEHDDQQQVTNLSEWSMNINNPPRTSWYEIKTKSLSNSSYSSSTNTSQSGDNNNNNPLTLYHLFQRKKSQQHHPCHLYQNFSDKSMCNSLTSSSSFSCRTPKPRIKLKSPITFSQIKLQSKTFTDQCLQTSFINNSIVIRTKSEGHLVNNHSQSSLSLSSSSTTRQSLPNLDFLTYYAKENPTSLTTLKKPLCKAMKSSLSLVKKNSTHTIFYCIVDIPLNRSTIFHSSLQKLQTLKRNETLSSVHSSSSSSGYFSNSSRHIQTPLSSYPLKSCLKRRKTEELTKDTSIHQIEELSKHRRYSAPTTSHQSERTNSQICTLSEHDLRTKKSVSFCNEIARRLIISSTSTSKNQNDYYDLILSQENFTDSPPNEFNLSDNNDNEKPFINFIENISENQTNLLLNKYKNEKNLINTFANTILRILEIKCNDPKSLHLNNQINHELDRILRQDLCSLLREILEDGLKQNSNNLFSKKINLWRLIELTTPTTGRLNEAKIKSQVDLAITVDWIEKFNSFIYQLLNLHELTSWLTYFIFQRTILNIYYESWAFILVNINNDLLENITNQLEKLSPLSFRLKYTISLTKKFQVRTWLRDKKTQMKISPKESSVPPNIIIRRKFNSIPVTKQ